MVTRVTEVDEEVSTTHIVTLIVFAALDRIGKEVGGVAYTSTTTALSRSSSDARTRMGRQVIRRGSDGFSHGGTVGNSRAHQVKRPSAGIIHRTLVPRLREEAHRTSDATTAGW